MFATIGEYVARRSSRPRSSLRVPWLKILLGVAIVAALITGVVVASERYSDSIYQEQVTTAPAVSRAPGPEPQVVVPIAPAPAIVDYRVTWAQVRGFDPFTLPTEEGFYSGTMPDGYSYAPGDPNSFPETAAYAWKILPQLEGERADWNKNILVAAARAPENEDVVFVGITADRSLPFILLSVDGEKSWCRLNLLPVPRGAMDTRVQVRDGLVHLYAQDARPGYAWWDTVVRLSDLPCFSQ